MLHFYLEANPVGCKNVSYSVLHEHVDWMKNPCEEMNHLGCDNVIFHGLKIDDCHFSSGSQETRVIHVI